MKILLAENNILLREGLSLLVGSLFNGKTPKQVNDWGEINQHIENNSPDVMLINHRLTGSLSWRYDLKQITLKKPNCPICLIFSNGNNIDPHTAYQLGVKGSINTQTSLTELQEAITSISKGRTYFKGYDKDPNKPTSTVASPHLTSRQLEIMQLLKKGLTNKSISSTLALSEGTIKQHLNRTYRTLNANNRVEAIRLASQLGLV